MGQSHGTGQDRQPQGRASSRGPVGVPTGNLHWLCRLPPTTRETPKASQWGPILPHIPIPKPLLTQDVTQLQAHDEAVLVQVVPELLLSGTAGDDAVALAKHEGGLHGHGALAAHGRSVSAQVVPSTRGSAWCSPTHLKWSSLHPL